MIEDADLFEFILDMMLEYYITGEAFPFGFFDNAEDPQIWTDFILLHPNYVEVAGDPFIRGKRKERMWLKPTDSLKKIVQGGTRNEKTGGLYKNLPTDIIDSVKKGKIELNPLQVSHLKKKGNYFDLRGTSIIECVLKLLMYKDKLRSAQYAIADRHISPSEFYFIGETGDPADEPELEAFQDALVSSWTQPNRAIIWHHAVRVQWEGATGRVLPITPEMEAIDLQIMGGLMTSKAFVFGEGPTYATASVALDVLIQRYLLDRMRCERWMEKMVFGPICKIHKLYKPTEAELSHRIRVKKDRPLWTPDVVWTKQNLRDNIQRINIMQSLAEGGHVPWSMVLELLDINPEVAKKGVKEEQGEMPPAVPPGLPVAPPMPIPGLPATTPAVPEILGGGLPMAPTEKSEVIPPESHKEMELPNV